MQNNKTFFTIEGQKESGRVNERKMEGENLNYKSRDMFESEISNDLFSDIKIHHEETLTYPVTQQPGVKPVFRRFHVFENTPSKHDTMALEFSRLSSMQNYPNIHGISFFRMAEAGFFYEGNGNELVCFSCGFHKDSWNFNDSPREIHLRMSPNCKFLSQGDGNVPVPREKSTQDLVPLQSAPQEEVVEPDGLREGYNASTSNNTAHLASAIYSDGQDQPDTSKRTMVVKHPKYASRPARMASYANFLRNIKQHPADMTEAGFYYAGFADCCRCYHCGIGLRNWDPEDNPWIEHARWSMECPYILKIKGQAFIDLVQAARAAEMAQDDEDSETEGASNGNDSGSGNGEKSWASNSSASEGPAANEIENNVAKTSEATTSKGTFDDSGFGSDSAPVVQPIKAPLRTPAAQSLIHDEKIKPKYVTAAIEDLVKAEGWGAFSKENIRKYLKIHEENCKSESSASNADPNTLKQENKELKDLTNCKICLDEKVSIVFLPCGHLVSCPQCAPALTKCPICKKNIKGTVRTNLVEKVQQNGQQINVNEER
ncbi:baculoviral IAP repeat-containing protein 7-like [Saccostrea cucullata]|uniref:baculoviral IAP repeat-containing protein 7-like n=1 Tax=Saccostrea cuccullata TaxID=36930 RepID=UPI002ED5245D